MDIGHSRHLRWVKNDDPSAVINADAALTVNGRSAAQNRWIAYNKMRGQYASAMEHAMPEEFWTDKSQCSYTDGKGQIKNPSMAACTEAISAVKAMVIAQKEGQKIYTINKSNRETAISKLSFSGDAGDEIRSAIQAGKEVVFHEKSINANGWTGLGYIILDPDTGVGAFLIEGGGSGGFLGFLLALFYIGVVMFVTLLIIVGLAIFLYLFLTPMVALAAVVVIAGMMLYFSAEKYLNDKSCAKFIFKTIALAIMSLPISLLNATELTLVVREHLSGPLLSTGLSLADGAGVCMPS